EAEEQSQCIAVEVKDQRAGVAVITKARSDNLVPKPANSPTTVVDLDSAVDADDSPLGVAGRAADLLYYFSQPHPTPLANCLRIANAIDLPLNVSEGYTRDGRID